MWTMKRCWTAAGIALALAAAAALAWYAGFWKPPVFALDSRDTIASWNFTGVYANDASLEAQARATIADLTTTSSSTGDFSPYNKFLGIAQEYDLLGDGAHEYSYLLKAIRVGGKASSVGWHNLGVLLERLGAYNSARTAYANSVAAAPTVGAFREAEVNLLIAHFGAEQSAIEAAFASGLANGLDPNMYPLQAAWLTSMGSTTAAIAAWRAFEAYVPAAQQAAIEKKIAQLKTH